MLRGCSFVVGCGNENPTPSADVGVGVRFVVYAIDVDNSYQAIIFMD